MESRNKRLLALRTVCVRAVLTVRRKVMKLTAAASEPKPTSVHVKAAGDASCQRH